MEEIEVDPWIRTEMGAYDTYSVPGSLFTIPFEIADGLTFKKSSERYLNRSRMIPRKYSKIIDDKTASMIQLDQPVSVHLSKSMEVYLKGGSSEHMTTILDGIDEAGFCLGDVDILVASETLDKIAGAVFKPDVSWRLRAHLEVIQRKRIIVLCDDDLDEIDLPRFEFSMIAEKRRESLAFAQRLCSREETRKTDPTLHGSRVILSTLQHRDAVVKMIVIGEVDMSNERQTVNAAVMTGRINRVCLGHDQDSISESFDYLWSRCFWMGMTNCIIGMRSEENEPVKTIHRFDLKEYYHGNRKRFEGLPDVATTCVAQVMNRLREAVESVPQQNWIIEFEGRDEELEPAYIKISMASETRSFWLVREHFHLIKSHCASRRAQDDKKLEKGKKKEPKILTMKQKKRRGFAKIRTDSTDLKTQFAKVIAYLSS